MKRFYPALYVAAAILIFGPVAWRVLTWERPQPQKVDVDMASAGEVLFKHEWRVNDPLSPDGDGIGPVFNAKSCVACHNQSGIGGGGDLEHNVTTFLVLAADDVTPLREGVIHAFASSPEFQETLKNVDDSLPQISQPTLAQLVSGASRRRGRIVAPVEGNNALLSLPTNVRLSQRNTPALFGIGLIDLIPEQAILANERQQQVQHAMAPGDTESTPVGRVNRLADGRIGRFGWKAQTARLTDFVQAACANELGLGNPGQAQPKSLSQLDYLPLGLDLTQSQCDQLTAYVAALPRPTERTLDQPIHEARAAAGKNLFSSIGCADCHTPNLGPVQGIFSDLLLHRMGADLQGGSNYYGTPPTPTVPTTQPTGPLADEWRTPPLWGVADSAPYMHDGRAATLQDAINAHGGQGSASAVRFKNLNGDEQAKVLAFLHSLRAP